MTSGARVAIATVLALAACDLPRPQPPVRVEIRTPVTRFTLPNGLDVVVQEDHKTPRVAINLRYHAGYKDDPPSRSGMAHLVEHLQFVEMAHLDRDAFYGAMIRLGAEDIDGATDDDGTSYYETVPTASLDSALWLEAERMASARLGWSDDAIAREKSVVAQEIKLRYRNQPDGFKYQLLTRGVYPEGHPYRRSLEEEAQERSSTSSDLRQFAQRYYGPNDATLMLVGDVTAERAKDLASRYFGAEPTCTLPPTRMVAPVERAAFKRLRVAADRESPMYFMAWPLPAPGDDGFYESGYAVGNLEGEAKWFAEEEKQTMAPRSFGWGIIERRLGSLGYIYASPTAKGTVDDFIDAIEIMRRRMVARDWSWVSSYRSDYIANHVRYMEGLAERARQMQLYSDWFGDPDHVMTDLHDVQLVTREGSVAAVDHFLDLDRAVVVVVTPDKNAPSSGKVVEEVPR